MQDKADESQKDEANKVIEKAKESQTVGICRLN